MFSVVKTWTTITCARAHTHSECKKASLEDDPIAMLDVMYWECLFPADRIIIFGKWGGNRMTIYIAHIYSPKHLFKKHQYILQPLYMIKIFTLTLNTDQTKEAEPSDTLS